MKLVMMTSALRFFIHLAREFQHAIHDASRLGLRQFPRIGQLAGIYAALFRRQKKNNLRRERIQFAAIIHDFGNVIVIIAKPEFDGKIFHLAKMLDEFVQRIQTIAAENREPQFFCR